MFFYCIEKDEIVKYEISLDEDKLKKLRSEIIEKCSEISYIHEEVINLPNYHNYEHIRNYHEKFLRRVDKGDFYGTIVDLYLVDYNYYDHPRLVLLIEELLKGNSFVISEIKNPQIENIDGKKILIDEQKEIIELLNDNKNNDITNQLQLLKENQKKLEQYKAKKELNKDQISVEPYYQKVFNCIQFYEVNRLSLKGILDVQEFLLDGNVKTLDTSLNKVLKLSIVNKK